MESTTQEEEILATNSPRNVLRKTLHPGATVPAAYLAEEASCTSTDTTSEMRVIGYGGCGIIFEQPGRTDVIKKAIKTVDDDLHNDYVSHLAIEASFDTLADTFGSLPCLPRVYHFISARDPSWWENNMHRFPKQNATRDNLLFSERIPPAPAIVRDALVDEYCLQEPLKVRAKADKANGDCLIRIYLGRKRERRTSGAPQRFFFALRNFKMDLQRLIDLGIETTQYARSMAIALAVMHWHSRLNARDVEFVLGGQPAKTHYPKTTTTKITNNNPSSPTTPNGGARKAVSLWLLDFNQCREISMDHKGVDEAVDAFCVNDPYYPRPSVDEQLWIVFRDQYLSASAVIMDGTDHSSLPGLFVQGVVARLNG